MCGSEDPKQIHEQNLNLAKPGLMEPLTQAPNFAAPEKLYTYSEIGFSRMLAAKESPVLETLK